MEKVKIGASSFEYPMPVVLVGAKVEGKANFMAAAWMMKANYKPLMLVVAIGKTHYTATGIQENRTFSVNLPGADLIEKTDYCGLVSGKEADKSGLFDVFYGDLDTAPMIEECSLCAECRLVEVCELPGDNVFVGEVVTVYSDEKYFTDGKLDMNKMKPFLLTTTDKSYRAVGEILGKAWHDGLKLKEQRGK